jgi:hypothetical protein
LESWVFLCLRGLYHQKLDELIRIPKPIFERNRDGQLRA